MKTIYSTLLLLAFAVPASAQTIPGTQIPSAQIFPGNFGNQSYPLTPSVLNSQSIPNQFSPQQFIPQQFSPQQFSPFNNNSPVVGGSVINNGSIPRPTLGTFTNPQFNQFGTQSQPFQNGMLTNGVLPTTRSSFYPQAYQTNPGQFGTNVITGQPQLVNGQYFRPNQIIGGSLVGSQNNLVPQVRRTINNIPQGTMRNIRGLFR